MPGDLQHSYKDSTRPPPCSTQDGATEGSSAVWKQSNKLLLQSGRDFSQSFLKMGLTHPLFPVTSESTQAVCFLRVHMRKTVKSSKLYISCGENYLGAS